MFLFDNASASDQENGTNTQDQHCTDHRFDDGSQEVTIPAR
jgi:hypothetical protein